MDKDKAWASPFKDPQRRRQYAQQCYKEKWYPLHRSERVDRSRGQKQKLREWYREYKKTLKCEDCGQNHPATLEFHHTDPLVKDFNVSVIIEKSTSLRRLQEEIAKCVVLCANCHRIKHWNERYGEGGDIIE